MINSPSVKGSPLLLQSALLFIGLLGLDGFAVLAADAPKMRIAYASRSSSAMPQYMAQGKGYFKAEGLDAELIQMNPRLAATAVVIWPQTCR